MTNYHLLITRGKIEGEKRKMNKGLMFITENQMWILMSTALFCLLLFFILVIQGFKIRKWKKKYYKMMGGNDFKTLEEMLTKYNHQVSNILENVEEILDRQKRVDEKLDCTVQKVGMVRYNAFHDMGSDLSYSIALLDGRDDGVVISAIHGRDFCNTYAKPVIKGESTYKLTAEEILAMDRAKKQTVYI